MNLQQFTSYILKLASIGGVILFFVLFPEIAAAQEGFVRCSGTTDDPCEFCHLAEMIIRIITFAIGVAFILAIMWFSYVGIELATAGGNVTQKDAAKAKFKSGVIGATIAFGAAFIIIFVMIVLAGSEVSLESLRGDVCEGRLPG